MLVERYPVDIIYLTDEPTVSSIVNELPDSTFGLIRKQITSWLLSAVFLFIGFYVLWGLIKELKYPLKPH